MYLFKYQCYSCFLIDNAIVVIHEANQPISLVPPMVQKLFQTLVEICRLGHVLMTQYHRICHTVAPLHFLGLIHLKIKLSLGKYKGAA